MCGNTTHAVCRHMPFFFFSILFDFFFDRTAVSSLSFIPPPVLTIFAPYAIISRYVKHHYDQPLSLTTFFVSSYLFFLTFFVALIWGDTVKKKKFLKVENGGD